LWEDFGWTAGATAAAAAAPTQDDLEWDVNVDEAAYAGAAAYREGPNGYVHRGMRNAATGHFRYADRGNQHERYNNVRGRMMTFRNWTQEEWEQMDLLQHPAREESPVSPHSSLLLLESVPVRSPSPPLQFRNPSPPPSRYSTPSPPPSPQPLQLQYLPGGEAGPSYALQVGPTLHLQPL
jgi:hypothetical protein